MRSKEVVTIDGEVVVQTLENQTIAFAIAPRTRRRRSFDEAQTVGSGRSSQTAGRNVVQNGLDAVDGGYSFQGSRLGTDCPRGSASFGRQAGAWEREYK